MSRNISLYFELNAFLQHLFSIVITLPIQKIIQQDICV